MGQSADNFDYFFCDNCRAYVYDERNGDLEHGVPPNTMMRCLPTWWQCPVCGASAKDLRAVTLIDDVSKSEMSRILERAKRAS